MGINLGDMLLQLFGILATLLVCLYVGFALYALLFTNVRLFPVPASGYKDHDGILKLNTASGLSITATHIEKPLAEYTILYCHGNSEDLATIKANYARLSIHGGYNVLAFDYPGYGTSEGRPNQRNLIEATEAAYTYLTEEKKIPPGKIILYGRSLGGGPATDLASRKPVGGLILEQAFTSVYRTVIPFRVLPWDHFDNLAKIDSIGCPLFILHGGADYTVPSSHGKALLAKAPGPKVHLWVDYAGHGDPLLKAAGEDYWKKLGEFQQLVEKQQD